MGGESRRELSNSRQVSDGEPRSVSSRALTGSLVTSSVSDLLISLETEDQI